MRHIGTLLLAAVLLGCGGGGGGDDGYPTTPGGNNPGGGTGGTGTPSGTPLPNASVNAKASDDGYGSATFAWDPRTVLLQRGGTVTWSNESGTAHTVTFDPATGAPANIATLTGSTSRTFGTAGTFAYECTLHPGMQGTITVR